MTFIISEDDRFDVASTRFEQMLERIEFHGDQRNLDEAIRFIAENLESHGVTFEGKQLPVSLTPTIVTTDDAAKLERAGACIRNILHRAIDLFIEEHRTSKLDGPMHRFFTPYYKVWDLIAAEQRHMEHIQLMRYDAVRDAQDKWKFLETNAGCPGGVIHCARIRDAWLATPFGQSVCGMEEIIEYSVDRPDGFIRFLADRAAQIDGDNPNIAIVNYRGVHTNELESLRSCYDDLREKGEISAGQLIIGDIRDVSVISDQAHLQGKPIALIYNKLPARLMDPDNSDIRGWINASRCGRTDFLNSWGATFLAGSKRALALVSDPEWNAFLDLTDAEHEIIRESVPATRLIENFTSFSDMENALLLAAKDALVLKADLQTRGSGVYIGNQTGKREWNQAVASTRSSHGVAQMRCDIPSRKILGAGDGSGNDIEYYGADAFFFGSDFAGLVSRSHTDQVFNVGNGGKESPVIILNSKVV